MLLTEKRQCVLLYIVHVIIRVLLFAVWKHHRKCFEGSALTFGMNFIQIPDNGIGDLSGISDYWCNAQNEHKNSEIFGY